MRPISFFASAMLLATNIFAQAEESFPSPVVPVPGFSTSTTSCLAAQPTYDKLNAIFSHAHHVGQQRQAEQQVNTSDLYENLARLEIQFSGLLSDEQAEDPDSEFPRTHSMQVRRNEDGSYSGVLVISSESESAEFVEPRVLVLMEDIASLMHRSRLDRYQGLMMHNFELGEVSRSFAQGDFRARTENLPETPDFLRYNMDVIDRSINPDPELGYSLDSSFLGWMLRLEEDEDSNLPHASARQICVRFACVDRNSLVDTQTDAFQSLITQYADIARQIHRLRRDYERLHPISSSDAQAEAQTTQGSETTEESTQP